MKVMVIVKATEESEAGVMPSSERFKEMGDFNEQLVKAGVMLAGEGLHPTSNGYRVRFSGTSRTVTQGPFAETRELIAGYWIWNVRSMEDAIEWVKKCPNPMTTDSDIEIRRIFEAEDFGDVFNQELREQEAAMKATLLGLHLIGFQNGKALQLVGINRPYTAESRSLIPKQWGEFVPWIGRIAGQVGKITYGVSWNCKPGCEFDYVTAVEVDSSSKTDESLELVSKPP